MEKLIHRPSGELIADDPFRQIGNSGIWHGKYEVSVTESSIAAYEVHGPGFGDNGEIYRTMYIPLLGAGSWLNFPHVYVVRKNDVVWNI